VEYCPQRREEAARRECARHSHLRPYPRSVRL